MKYAPRKSILRKMAATRISYETSAPQERIGAYKDKLLILVCRAVSDLNGADTQHRGFYRDKEQVALSAKTRCRQQPAVFRSD